MSTVCTTMDPTLNDVRQVMQRLTLEAYLYGPCFATLVSIIVHSSQNVPSKPVAHNHTTLMRLAAIRLLANPGLVDSWFNGPAALFPCGMGPNGRTLCAPNSTSVPTSGDMIALTAAYEGPIPLSDLSHYFQYGYVFDADGITTNNYQPAPPYVNDFFTSSDRWYTADFSPSLGWSLGVKTALNGTVMNVTNSNARLIMSGSSMTLIVPASEFTSMAPSFRSSAFSHLGDYGLNAPYNYDGSLFPAVADGLRPF